MYFGHLFSKEEQLTITVKDYVEQFTKSAPYVMSLPPESAKEAVTAITSKDGIAQQNAPPEVLQKLRDTGEYSYLFFSDHFKNRSELIEYLAKVTKDKQPLSQAIKIHEDYWFVFFTDTPDQYKLTTED